MRTIKSNNISRFTTVLVIVTLLISSGFWGLGYNRSAEAADIVYDQIVSDNSDGNGEKVSSDSSEDGMLSPYSRTIGFIGDSITQGTGASTDAAGAVSKTCENLGSDFICINHGIGGTTSHDWATTLTSMHGGDTDIMAAAIAAMQNADVDIVSIMLGANDARYDAHYSAESYKDQMQTIINRLRTAGFRHVILNYSIYFGFSSIRDALSQKLNIEYQTAIDELVTENTGFVSAGDASAYDWFKINSTLTLIDGDDAVHPNDIGYAKLGEFWSNAIMNTFAHKTKFDREWLNNDSDFRLSKLIHPADRYLPIQVKPLSVF